jgi:hypothetical protein
MSRFLTFIAFGSFVSLSSYAQKMEVAVGKDCQHPTPYSDMAVMVSRSNPRLTESALKADSHVIKDARPSLDKYFDRGGFNQCDVDQVIQQTWIQLRKENGNNNFTQAQFVQEASEYGGLRIKSTPSGATIWVDNAQWEKPTNTGRMTHIGTRKIKLLLEGYEDSFGEKEVLADQWTDYAQTLKKKQQ